MFQEHVREPSIERPARARAALDVDVARFEDELRRAVEGEIRAPAGGSVVVVARTKDDVVATHAVCKRFGVAIVPRGNGHALPTPGRVEVVLDLSKLDRILEIDPAGTFACVEAGTPLLDLAAAAKREGIAFGGWTTTGASSIGGMIANGDLSHDVEEIEVLLYDGTRMRLGWMTDGEMIDRIAAGGRQGRIYAALRKLGHRVARLQRRGLRYRIEEIVPDAAGRINVARALAGSAGTLATILEAKILVHGEHQDRERARFVDISVQPPDVADALRRFKIIWDPDGRMNPVASVEPAPRPRGRTRFVPLLFGFAAACIALFFLARTRG